MPPIICDSGKESLQASIEHARESVISKPSEIAMNLIKTILMSSLIKNTRRDSNITS